MEQPDDAANARLDFTSPEFDAGLALQAPGLQVPVPEAPVLDNISRCTGMLAPPDEEQPKQQQEAEQSAQEAQAKKAKAAALKQRALQAAQRAEASVKLGSLRAIMDVATAAAGPLAQLAKWHAAGQRIYVVTRHASGVRGRAVGTVVAYDRYLNLLLRDVEETYTVIVKVQRVKQQLVGQPQQQQQQQHQEQLQAASAAAQPQPSATPQQQQRPEAAASAVRTRTRWCRKQQHRYRQLDQILLRGDNIVLVAGTPPLLQPPADTGGGTSAAAATTAGL